MRWIDKKLQKFSDDPVYKALNAIYEFSEAVVEIHGQFSGIYRLIYRIWEWLSYRLLYRGAHAKEKC